MFRYSLRLTHRAQISRKSLDWNSRGQSIITLCQFCLFVCVCFSWENSTEIVMTFTKTKWFVIVHLASQVQPKSFKSTISFSSTHDYIIVGGGSAGCVLANRLSDNPDLKVLLLEAGPKDNSWRIQMPAAVPYNLDSDSHNWYYTSEPQQNLQNR